ncbi:alginate lyase family protein [Chromohalobacter canadensis]|uniref:Alginate lyase family protein n=1 Tax=Chromohalobacter canadensis TaxID=141389 RepID=A0ABZ0YBF1_9GAMM|nr:alginate lyase family protein [Chromohalobacter canadensis]MCK0770252.1 alginate lyase family protein [Chromohalobacter canadensis]WQH08929.1 alginate lyase family protein [Chromohalobacter canadensis]
MKVLASCFVNKISRLLTPFLHKQNTGEFKKAAAENLRKDYINSPASQQVDSFALYRIIGNDLIPRHAKGQSKSNLAFILENEPELPGCEKRFIVNRIVDRDEERSIIEMLESAGLYYIHIPFDCDEYRAARIDYEGVPTEYFPYTKKFSKLGEAEQKRVMMRLYRHKNNYVMNNNGARNSALRQGRSLAKWVLPWDGNCFVTAEAWEQIVSDVSLSPEYPYFLVPMARLEDNNLLFRKGFQPEAHEEPQLIFRSDSNEEFDPNFFYGRRPKVELFWRLGIAGPWERWKNEPWDLPRPSLSSDAGAYAQAGWVARLFSGQAHLENTSSGLVDRGVARNDAIGELIERLDLQVLQSSCEFKNNLFINGSFKLGEKSSFLPTSDLVNYLRRLSEEALARGPYSVTDKKTLPPSKDKHDYWHPAPYYWPNPIPIPGLPYLPRDGKRVPGTRLYEAMSDNYDRTRVQRLFDDTYTLTLAYNEFSEVRFLNHAASLVRRWFINPKTAMSPHLKYAQVRRGWNNNQGSSFGIVELKDFYFFLDAVGCLYSNGALDEKEMSCFQTWLECYLDWLVNSPQGRRERSSLNNHGTYYDLQIVAVAAFLGKTSLLKNTLLDSQCRIIQQFSPNGHQPEEMKRATTEHYCCFNLQGWIHLAELAERYGIDLWTIEGSDGRGLRKSMEWILSFLGKEWPYKQIDDFDKGRLLPIYHVYVDKYGELPFKVDHSVPSKECVKPFFFSHDGIRPFWQFT